MILYILRHASAGKRYTDPTRDHKRPLDKAGIEQSRRLGRWLAGQDFGVERVLASPLKRAAQTAALVANELGYEAAIQFDDALLPEAGFNDFRALLRRHHSADPLLVVGHNPSISRFLNHLVAGAPESGLALKKAALARLDVQGHSGELQWLVTPRLLESRPHAAAAVPARRAATQRK